MCEYFPGQLILAFSRHDPAGYEVLEQIRRQTVEHISYEQSLDEKLSRLGLQVEPTLELDLHLVAVPPGQELWKSNLLQFIYKHALLKALAAGRMPSGKPEVLADSRLHFTAAPNHLLTLCPRAPLARLPVSAADLSLGPVHGMYRAILGAPPAPSLPVGVPTRVLVIDSGVAQDMAASVKRTVDFASPSPGGWAHDENGHGTVVASIIRDLAPRALLTVYRVTDATHRASEWDTLAALATKTDAEIVNLSLAFGLLDAPSPCPNCGRLSGSSRSTVFETVLNQLLQRPGGPLVVAAAGNAAPGNAGQAQLAYPARFADVIAISSINLARELSWFSNYGDLDASGDQHLNRFSLPGGDSAPRPVESIGTFAGGTAAICGTSFATAYATGVIAHRLGTAGASQGTKAFLANLRGSADRSFAAYDAAKHGNGILRL